MSDLVHPAFDVHSMFINFHKIIHASILHHVMTVITAIISVFGFAILK